MDTNVERLHRALVSAVAQARAGDFSQPVTVSEIYQQLLPYRAARAAVGFDMNADYEYALLRLLAGEGNLARLEPGEVRELLRSELESPNPDVGIFRQYANCDVWVTAPPKWVFEMVDDAQPAMPPFTPDESEDNGVEAAADAAEDEIEGELLLEDEVADEVAPPAPRPARPEPAPTPPSPVMAAGQCSFCAGDLPPGRLVNFCPHCGHDLSQRACSTCGETLDSSWRFCANCGTKAPGYDTAAN